jgi:hypothetical protein
MELPEDGGDSVETRRSVIIHKLIVIVSLNKAVCALYLRG